MRRPCAPLADHRLGGCQEGVAAGHDRLRPPGAAAGSQLVAVALHEFDGVDRQAQPVGRHLGEGGRVALALVQRPGQDGDASIGTEPDSSGLLARPGRDLQIGRHRPAAQKPVRCGLRTTRLVSVPVGPLRRLVQDRPEITAVIDPCPRPPCRESRPRKSGFAGAASADRARFRGPPHPPAVP